LRPCYSKTVGMPRKLFIVDPANERLYAALRSALANETDVEIFFDRRTGESRRWNGADRRVAPDDVRDRIRTDGFAVVRPSPPEAASRNIRWA
jgi:hypothetical protein